MSKHASKLSVLQFKTKLVLIGIFLFAIGSVFSAGGASAANPSANLDQCANGSLASPNNPACNPNEWVNGNLGASKAHYLEGDSIPYRLRFDNLSTTGTRTVVIEWDTTKSSKHAIDYLTTFDRTVTTANPCVGVSGCNPLSFSTFAIPADPQVTGAGVTPIAGEFRLYGGTITNVGPTYSYPNGTGFTGDKSARISIEFTASVANPVLAWGGHIATRQDWGQTNSAVAIPGSPYHMRLISLDGSGGNQDRSLSTEAVIFPASITIVKDAVPNDPQDFAFTTTGGLSPASFSLDDDADGTLSNQQVYSGILVTSNTGNNYTVTETPVSHWALSFPGATCTVTSPNGGSTSHSTTTWTINLREGENVTCTFINTHTVNTPTINTTLSDDSITVGDTIHDSATLSNATADAGGTVTYSIYTDNTCTTPAGASDGVVGTPGTVTVTNGVVPISGDVTFNNAGDFYWQAVYSGDPNNSSATSVCASEHLVVNPAAPGITTSAVSPVTVGADIHDTATMTGIVNGVAGSITFDLFDNATCTGPAIFTDTVTGVNSNGNYDSGNYTTTTTGNFFWVASYSGDANNDPATTTCGEDGETSHVNPAAPGITTSATAEVDLGSPIHDTAHISGLVNPDGTGTITFTAYSDAACTTSVFTDDSDPVTDNGDYDSADFTPGTAGSYYWIASFSGDANNDPATTACGDPGETSVVKTTERTGQITPTGTTCNQFNNDQASTLSELLYTVKSSKINSVAPGVFFYWIKVDATAGSNTFTINQAITTGNFDSHFFSQASGSFVFNSNCTKVATQSISTSGGVTTVNFTAPSDGTYIIGIKYDSGSVKGFLPTGNGIVHYDFSAGGVPGSTQGLDLKPKP